MELSQTAPPLFTEVFDKNSHPVQVSDAVVADNAPPKDLGPASSFPASVALFPENTHFLMSSTPPVAYNAPPYSSQELSSKVQSSKLHCPPVIRKDPPDFAALLFEKTHPVKETCPTSLDAFTAPP